MRHGAAGRSLRNAVIICRAINSEKQVKRED